MDICILQYTIINTQTESLSSYVIEEKIPLKREDAK